MKPRVVIVGSFHRQLERLARAFRELEACGCRVLSPISIDFSSHTESFVRTPTEYRLSDTEIEKFHLRAILSADFIWLHSPDGYVGTGGAFEIGYADAAGIPAFCTVMPDDPIIGPRVHVISSVFEALEMYPMLKNS